jgi:iron complex transport system ATP-binding protein
MIASVRDAPILQLTNATIVKDERPVLDDVSLTIREGEHTAILGPNGAGKSLLVSLLTHYERPLARTGGTPPVRVFGESSWNVADLRSRLGIVSADLHLHFVAGNSEGRIKGEAAVLSAFLTSHGILRYGVITDDMRARAADAFATVGAAHLASRWMDQMSSGEARRVMLARVLVTSPRVLVLDEPTTGLDLGARHSFMEHVRRIARTGTTILLVTHHLDEIIPEIRRVVLLKDGRITAQGPKETMLTAESMTGLFGLAVAVEDVDGYHYARPTSVPAATAVQGNGHQHHA